MLLTRGLTYSLSTAVRTSRGHSLSVHERRLTGHHELGIGLGREGLRTSDPRRVCRSVWHFAFPGTLPRCLPEPVDESAICRICAGLDKEALYSLSHSATPPGCEQVPWRVRLKLNVPSRQWAVAPSGGLPSAVRVGDGPHSPWELM